MFKTGYLMPAKSNTKYNGVPLENVSKMLGHKNIRTTERYCKVRKERISENMVKVRKILFTQTGTLKLVV